MSRKRPNVLLVTADQLRYDAVEPNAPGAPSTPHLARLAAEGVRFAHAYSHIPVCGPARQSLLCGRRPETFGGLWNAGGALPVASLPPDAWTWSQALADAGYRSAFLGKWGVHPTLDPTSYGYDTYVGESDYAAFRKAEYLEVEFKNGYFGEPNPIPVEASSTHWFADRAAAELRRLHASGGPWHMAIHFAEPHLPCRPSGRFADMYAPEAIKPWPGFEETFAGKPYIQRQQLYNWGVERYTWADWSPIVARYFGVVSQLDDAIGRVLGALDDLGAADDTLLVFTSDHGDMCGSHRMMDKHYVLYDDVVRVPMAMRWPRALPQGTVLDRFAYNFLDLAPTFLELLELEADASVRAGFHGRSLAPLLSGRPDPSWREDVVATYNGQQFGLYTQRMIRTERWKYVWNLTDVDELYDVQADPGELENRIGETELADTVRGLRVRLHETLRRDGDGFDNEWMRRQLVEGRKL
ncbi:DUF4976 domain-containing protein [Paenibacillus antri]|uniref:DUF4976 domain-containing protein n=1 Tax=Paenibacillus antri TaxID=2582848 RepID=A0A5R9G9X0_9BACL|nr:sulfatase-like hydrolase/transferase [Paenibacillus antri]TLS53242.1 DUF4976 domain-containing protein [Paenibacillus antri]